LATADLHTAAGAGAGSEGSAATICLRVPPSFWVGPGKSNPTTARSIFDASSDEMHKIFSDSLYEADEPYVTISKGSIFISLANHLECSQHFLG
jgi:hypothetical protein